MRAINFCVMELSASVVADIQVKFVTAHSEVYHGTLCEAMHELYSSALKKIYDINLFVLQ